ncbi:MAG: hypothetical protein A2X49_14030 [Lentisphaerae bacterium GWF2_52_8]|nr:MAG: hypothetical protein A2X49_14030 [Lentisphaerae bacterium GWF2_52_8]
MGESLIIRGAGESDIETIRVLLANYAGKQLLLPRTAADIRGHLSDFFIAEKDSRFVGCVALRDFGNNLYEVRSLAVFPAEEGHGIGSALINHAVDSLRGRGPMRVFALTYRTSFFLRLGFDLVVKDLFPEKIWSDCSICAKKDCCDEDAVLLEIE